MPWGEKEDSASPAIASQLCRCHFPREFPRQPFEWCDIPSRTFPGPPVLQVSRSCRSPQGRFWQSIRLHLCSESPYVQPSPEAPALEAVKNIDMRQNLILERQDEQPHGSKSRARSYPDHDLLASASLLAGCQGHVNLSYISKFTYKLASYLLAGLLSIFCSLDLPVCVLSKGLADAASDVWKVRLYSRDCFLSCWPPKTSKLGQCR